MKKTTIITLLMALLMVVFVNAEICTDTPLSNKNCEMVTPQISCTTYNYTVYDENKTINEIGNLSLWADGNYYFNFSKQDGKFIINLCDGTYREVYVNGDGEVITGSILAIIGVIGILLFVYHRIDDENHMIFRTFLLCFIIFLTILVPRALFTLTQTKFSLDFIGYYTWFLRIFIFYLAGYFLWSLMNYYGKTEVFKQFFKKNFGKKGG